mmetsp:Transcript_36853/g.67994  ORF Transcript_36853/g.67994 Transcript_36853/m.67994 type:complete len:212 (-) Transcript_36853:297-932(-)
MEFLALGLMRRRRTLQRHSAPRPVNYIQISNHPVPPKLPNSARRKPSRSWLTLTRSSMTRTRGPAITSSAPTLIMSLRGQRHRRRHGHRHLRGPTLMASIIDKAVSVSSRSMREKAPRTEGHGGRITRSSMRRMRPTLRLKRSATGRRPREDSRRRRTPERLGRSGGRRSKTNFMQVWAHIGSGRQPASSTLHRQIRRSTMLMMIAIRPAS